MPKKKNGWATAEYAWADKKNKTSERYFDADGQPYVLAKGGYSGIDREFDADMRVTRVTYYDASGRIGPNADGVVIQTRAYDDNGYLSLVWYYGADGQLMYYDGIGAYGEAYERDADGNVTTDTLLDSDGRMMAGNNGWAQAQYAYADAKHRTSERYYDAAGHPFVL